MSEKHNKNILSLEDILGDDAAKVKEEEKRDKSMSSDEPSPFFSRDIMALPSPEGRDGFESVRKTQKDVSDAPLLPVAADGDTYDGSATEHECEPQLISSKSKRADDVFGKEQVFSDIAAAPPACNTQRKKSIFQPMASEEQKHILGEKTSPIDEDSFAPIKNNNKAKHETKCAEEAPEKEIKKEEIPDVKKAPDPEISKYTERELRRIVKDRCETDINLIRERYEHRLAALRLEYAGAKLRFDKKSRIPDGSRSESEIYADIAATEHRMSRAVKREKKYNKRVFTPILTDYKTAPLSSSKNREHLMELRAELFLELEKRDKINKEAMALLLGEDGSTRGGLGDKSAAEIKGKKRAYKKQKKVDDLIHKYHVSRQDSKRLYEFMDEYIECAGELARVTYTLKNEKPSRFLKKSLKKERRKLRRTEWELEGHIEHYKQRAVEAALGKGRARFRSGALWIGIALLAGLLFSLVANWESFIGLFS